MSHTSSVCVKSVFIFLAICMHCKAEQENCCLGPQQMRLAVRYTTPKGIGYDTSYSTMEGFFAPQDFLWEEWLPFLDARGHIFNDGRWAANAGVGLRFLPCSRVWGVNAYYDYRNTSSENFNQVSVGLESLGTVWDFRINGYLPVRQEHNRFHKSATFQGNSLLIHYSQRFAMKGANAEVGIHVDYCNVAPLYFAAGPYYLTAAGMNAWGGELHAHIDLFDHYLLIEGNTSYDSIFKWIGQAQVSINIPIWGKCRADERTIPTLNERAVQRVDFFEIIPVVKRRTIKPALNPTTGQPWIF